MARRAYLYSTSLVLRWMIRLNIGVLLLLFAASPVVVPIFFNIAKAAGNTYYVDCNRPDDTGNGTSPSTAWKTINKVNNSSFSAGDSILFNKGCTWREQLAVPSSGSAGNPITFGAYGSGAKPIVNGADLVTGWAVYSGTTYQAAAAFTPNQAFRGGTRLIKDGTYPTVDGHWYWVSNVFYLCCGDPTSLTIEASHRDLVVSSTQAYVTLSGLNLVKGNINALKLSGASHTNLVGVDYYAASRQVHTGHRGT